MSVIPLCLFPGVRAQTLLPCTPCSPTLSRCCLGGRESGALPCRMPTHHSAKDSPNSPTLWVECSTEWLPVLPPPDSCSRSAKPALTVRVCNQLPHPGCPWMGRRGAAQGSNSLSDWLLDKLSTCDLPFSLDGWLDLAFWIDACLAEQHTTHKPRDPDHTVGASWPRGSIRPPV